MVLWTCGFCYQLYTGKVLTPGCIMGVTLLLTAQELSGDQGTDACRVCSSHRHRTFLLQWGTLFCCYWPVFLKLEHRDISENLKWDGAHRVVLCSALWRPGLQSISQNWAPECAGGPTSRGGCHEWWDKATTSVIPGHRGWDRPGADQQLLTTYTSCNSNLELLSAQTEPKFSSYLFISVLTHPLYHSLEVKKLYT